MALPRTGTVSYTHLCALKALIAGGDADFRRGGRGRALGADHEVVVRVNAVVTLSLIHI